MAKKKEEAAVKTDTKKAAAKSAAKESTIKKVVAKKTTAKAVTKKTSSKVTPINKAAADTDEKKALEMAEHEMAASCQNMLSSIVSWSMDALMYSNILLISKKMNLSIEEAAAVLNVDVTELIRLTAVYNAYTKTPAGDRAGILGKYNDRITKI